jgi:PAS domain S-box-containing protein
MKAKEKIVPAFLTGGGEMGQLIRAFDWSTTAIGTPDTWPQSLRIAVRIMLDCPFGMYIAWGNDYIQMYNDGYRPILGATKHPQALGISTPKSFAEIWPTIGPMFEGVMQGKPVGLTDFVVHLDRNGFLEECVFDFSYSPIRLEDGKVGGVLTTVIETTEKVKAVKALKESESRFQNLVREANVGIIVLSGEEMRVGVVNEAYCQLIGLNTNDLLGKPLFDMIPDGEVNFRPILNKVRVSGESLYLYDQPYSVIMHGEKIEGYLNVVYQAYKETDGTITGVIALCQDVSEIIKSRKRIEESEAKFKMLSETIPHMVWTATPDGKKNFFNKYFQEYTGLSFEELKDNGWHKIICPDDLERELTHWRHIIQMGEEFKIEKRVRHHNGTYRWHICHSIPQKNAAGEITEWIGTNTEIEEQKKFAEELETSVKERTYQLHIQNETFKQAEESSLQGNYSFNLTTGQLAYSDNLFRLIGYEPNEFEPSLEEFSKHVHPEDRDYVNRAAEEVLAGKKADAWHYRMTTKNGALINIKGTGRVIESGDEKLLVGTLQDVTKEFELNKELQEKEAYRQQIIHNAPDAVIVINEHNIITLWNPKTEEIFGWKAEEVLGSDLTNTIVPLQYRQRHREGMKRFLKTGEARILNKTLELTALNKEGKEFPISLTISQATQQGNKLFIAFLRDITLEKRTIELAISNQALLKANAALEQSQKLSEKLLKQKDEFISIASHEMKTPLTTAKGYTELLLLSLSEENQSVLYATKANKAIDRLQDLVTELLDASKIQNGQLNYNIGLFDLNKMLDETIENIQHSTKTHRIQKAGTFSSQITGDRNRLQQVLINLLTNAVKYSPSADKVLVKIKEQEGKIQVSVQDFGIGMPGKDLNKIFDRYYRVEEHAVHFQGLGIGLYISHNIIERHNGELWAESEPGKGSTFYFTLPL